MKRLLSLLLAALLTVSLAGCARVDDVMDKVDSAGDPTTTGGAATTTTGVSAVDGFAEGYIGDVMHTYFFDYTVNEAYTCTEFHGYTPAEGKQLLVAEVTVANTDTRSVEMYDTDFQAQWGETGDNDYSLPITVDADPVSSDQLPSIYELGVKESTTGLLVFEVPEGKKDFSVSYLEVFDNETEGDTFFVYFTANSR